MGECSRYRNGTTTAKSTYSRSSCQLQRVRKRTRQQNRTIPRLVPRAEEVAGELLRSSRLQMARGYCISRVTVSRSRNIQVDATPRSGDLEQRSKGHRNSGNAVKPLPCLGSIQQPKGCRSLRFAIRNRFSRTLTANRIPLDTSLFCCRQRRRLAPAHAPLLPGNQHRRGDGDRGVRADKNSYHERE